MSCVVVGYTSRCVDSSLSFHRIPKEEKWSHSTLAECDQVQTFGSASDQHRPSLLMAFHFEPF